MADQKISELTNITGANLADADEFVVVDVSDNIVAVAKSLRYRYGHGRFLSTLHQFVGPFFVAHEKHR